jgi:hypothetical protein
MFILTPFSLNVIYVISLGRNYLLSGVNLSGGVVVPSDHRQQGIPAFHCHNTYQRVLHFYVFLLHIFAVMNSRLICLH